MNDTNSHAPLLCTQCTAPLKGDVCEYCGTRFANVVPRVVSDPVTLNMNIPRLSMYEAVQRFSEAAAMSGYCIGTTPVTSGGSGRAYYGHDVPDAVTSGGSGGGALHRSDEDKMLKAERRSIRRAINRLTGRSE